MEKNEITLGISTENKRQLRTEPRGFLALDVGRREENKKETDKKQKTTKKKNE